MSDSFTIGRDPACDITLADESVSRLHAEVQVLDDGRAYLHDRGSINGTYVTQAGERRAVVASVWLKDIDTVEIGDVVIALDALGEMVRSARAAKAANAAAALQIPPHRFGKVAGVLDQRSPHPQEVAPHEGVGRAGLVDFVPLVSGFERLRQRKLLAPSIAFAVLVILLMGAQSRKDPFAFLNTLGVAACLGSLVVVYRLCGKHKPWLALGAVMLAEAVILKRLSAPYFFVFRDLTGVDPLMESASLPLAFVGHFIGAGLMEELMKMTPALILIALSSQLTRSRLSKWTAIEPLDVILYACAAATMFVMIETLEQYVPNAIDRTFKEFVLKTGSKQVGALQAIMEGSQLAIIRTLNGAAGHLAYSGYFGYYVGLGLLRPSDRLRLWLGGYLGAAALHGASNAITGSGSMTLLLFVKLVTVSFLVTAILNARKVSPTRAENFATVALTRAR